jgi:hypothetical protein
MGKFEAAKFGAIFPIQFSDENIVTNQSNTDITMLGAGNTLFVPPKAGSIVAISARLTAAVTAGTLTIKAHKDGTELTESGAPVLTMTSASNSQEGNSSCNQGVARFAANQGVGLSYTSTTDMAPTNTNDVDAWLFVALDPE